MFSAVWLLGILALSLADEGYSGDSSCSLILIFFILFFSSTFQLCRGGETLLDKLYTSLVFENLSGDRDRLHT